MKVCINTVGTPHEFRRASDTIRAGKAPLLDNTHRRKLRKLVSKILRDLPVEASPERSDQNQSESTGYF